MEEEEESRSSPQRTLTQGSSPASPSGWGFAQPRSGSKPPIQRLKQAAKNIVAEKRFLDGAAEGAAESGTETQVKLATFKLKSVCGLTRSFNAEVAFLPAKQLTSQKLSEILHMDWKLPRPNLLVNLDSGATHPSEFANEQLRSLPQFEEWKKYARKQIKLPGAAPHREAAPTGAAPASGSQEPEDTDVKDIINGLVFNKMVTVFTALVDASQKTQHFIIVDRTDPRFGSSPAADLLLELALQQIDVPPTILVVDSLSRLKKHKGEEADRQMDQLIKILANSWPRGQEGQDKPPVEMPALYNAHEFSSCEKFAELDCPLGEHEPTHKDANGDVEKDKRWSYHCNQYMFSSGTHYIILHDETDLLDWDKVGTMGGVFAHGGTLAYERMRWWLQRGKPTVMLFNTGGVTQAFASLHHAVVKQSRNKEGTPEALKQSKNKEGTEEALTHHNINKGIKDALESFQVASQEKWGRLFGVSDVVMMQELYRRAPVATRKAIVSVDILKHSADDVLHVVTGCFANARGHLPELGLHKAEANVVLQAWGQHVTLYATAQSQRKYADTLFGVQIALLFLTSLCSTLISSYQQTSESIKSDQADSIAEAMEYLLVVVPIISGLVATVMQRKRALEKWGVLTAGAARIVAEIYKFRARVLEYDASGTSNVQENPGEDADVPAGNGDDQDRRVRMRFVKRLQNIFSQVMGENMDTDSLDTHKALIVEMDWHGPPVDEVALKNHVLTNLLKVGPAPRPEANHDEDIDMLLDTFEEDDLKSNISIETYMAKRTQP